MIQVKILLFFLFFVLAGKALSFSHSEPALDFILKAESSKELNTYLKKKREKNFLKKLCMSQKKEEKIPLACYELGENADFYCLNLKLEDLRRLKELEQALKSSFLSEKCRKKLKAGKELLKYREKDFFLPELKSYWTGEKAFF